MWLIAWAAQAFEPDDWPVSLILSIQRPPRTDPEIFFQLKMDPLAYISYSMPYDFSSFIPKLFDTIKPLNSENLLKYYGFCSNISCKATQMSSACCELTDEFTILRTSNGNNVVLQLEIRDKKTSKFELATVFEFQW